MKVNYILYSMVGVIVVFALTLSMFSATTVSVPELFEVEDQTEQYDKGVQQTTSSDSCFLAGTEVMMADLSFKYIEDIKVGDFVYGAKGKSKVLELESPLREGYYNLNLVDGTKLQVTNEHPIYARNSKGSDWASFSPKDTYRDSKLIVSDLGKMEEVYTFEGWVLIKDYTYVKEEVQTYNLKSVEGNTFFAEGILVHNKCSPVGEIMDVSMDLGQASMNDNYDGSDYGGGDTGGGDTGGGDTGGGDAP